MMHVLWATSGVWLKECIFLLQECVTCEEGKYFFGQWKSPKDIPGNSKRVNSFKNS